MRYSKLKKCKICGEHGAWFGKCKKCRQDVTNRARIRNKVYQHNYYLKYG